jgi:hypothetical protein
MRSALTEAATEVQQGAGSIHQIDPLQDVRWADLVERHAEASIFHTPGWLKALHCTYGYEPVAFTTSSSNEQLQNGLVFCRVRSWLTGDRMISLPFSDHCEPLFDSGRDLNFIIEDLRCNPQHRRWKYIEIRPVNWNLSKHWDENGFRPVKRYYLHRMDLRPDLNQLFRTLHKDSVQRRIRRAERAGIVHERGRSTKLLNVFYELLVLTRRRHRLPPQPYVWFCNLIDSMNDALEIRVAYQAQIPIAAILTLRFRNTVYYKYGCSNAKFNHLGGMPFLLWKTIEESKVTGAEEFDLGRSDSDDKGRGLVSFKNHWGKGPTDLVYGRFAAPDKSPFQQSRGLNIAKRFCAHMPTRLFTATGRLIYRHIA